MTPLSQWQRIRLNPAAAKTWNRAGELTIDYNVRISHEPHTALQWLTLFDGTRSTQQLLESAAAMGMDSERATSHFRDLAHNGTIFEVDTIPAALGDTRTMYDTRAAGLTFEKTSLDIAADRQSLRVCVVGIGVVPQKLVTSLESSGYLTGWSITTTARITDEDVHLGNMSPSFVGRRWMDFARVIKNPQLVILVDDVIDITQIDLQYCDSVIVPVQIRTKQIEIGPVLHAHNSVCAECVYEEQKRVFEDWPMMLTQLLHHRRAQPIVNSATTALTVAQLEMLTNHIASGRTMPLTSHSLSIKNDDVMWEIRDWKHGISQHCRCGSTSTIAR
ncbi:MAG: hypothetical protein RL410_1561 [Actinomycetota bacterium]|jgi:hypothetical protein